MSTSQKYSKFWSAVWRHVPRVDPSLVLLLLVAVLVIVPWVPAGIGNRPLTSMAADISAYFGGFQLLVEGKKWGVDTEFPYGPLFILKYPYYFPGLLGLHILGCVAIAIGQGAAFWGAVRLNMAARKSVWVSFGIAIVVAHYVTWMASQGHDPVFTSIFFTLNILFFIYDAGRRQASGVTLVVAAAAAVVALGKFPWALILAFNLVLFLISDVRGRRLPLVPVVTFLSFSGWWLAAGQSPDNFLAYIKTSWSMADGFGEAMGIGYFETGRVLQVLLLLGAMALLAVLQIACRERFRSNFDFALSFLGLAFLYYVDFKHGIVRHDGHVAHAAMAFLTFALLWLLILPYDKLSFRISAVYSGLTALVSVAMIIIHASAGQIAFHVEDNRVPSLSRAWHFMAQRFNQFAIYLANGEAAFKPQFERDRAWMQAKVKLPELSGTWDAFPDYASILVVAGKEYSPRPNFLGFNTYNPDSSKNNARYLATVGKGADNILFHTAALDYKMPTGDDPYSWLEILSGYDVAGVGDLFTVMRRAERPRPYRMTPFVEKEIAWGEPLVVENPGQRMVWAEIDVKANLANKLVSLAYKPPEIYLEASLASGAKAEYRVVPLTLRGGVLLSPMIQDDLDFLSLYIPEGRDAVTGKAVTQIRLQPRPGLTGLYADKIKVRLSWIDFDGAFSAKGTGPEMFRLFRLASMKARAPKQVPIPAQYRSEPGKIVLMMHAPNSVEMPLNSQHRRAVVKFGMLPGTYASKGLGDGVRFIVRGVLPDGSRKELWSRHLHPSDVPGDQGEQEASFNFDSGRYSGLEFVTDPAGSPSYDASFWADARTE